MGRYGYAGDGEGRRDREDGGDEEVQNFYLNCVGLAGAFLLASSF